MYLSLLKNSDNLLADKTTNVLELRVVSVRIVVDIRIVLVLPLVEVGLHPMDLEWNRVNFIEPVPLTGRQVAVLCRWTNASMEMWNVNGCIETCGRELTLGTFESNNSKQFQTKLLGCWWWEMLSFHYRCRNQFALIVGFVCKFVTN